MSSDLLPREWLIAAAAIGGMILLVLLIAFVSARWPERRSARARRTFATTVRSERHSEAMVPTQRRPLTPAELRRLNELYDSGSISRHDYARLRAALDAGQSPAVD